MNILFLSDNFPPEGNAPATRTWEHTRRWVAAGHRVTIITCAPNFPEGEVYEGYANHWRTVEVVDGVRVVRVKTYISANKGNAKRILDYVSFMLSATFFGVFERRPDVVVATSPQFFCAVAGWFVSILKWRPFVFEVRDLWPASIVAVGAMRRSRVIIWLERLELFLYRRARAIVVVTRSFEDDLVSRGVDPKKISVVFNGVDEGLKPLPRDEDLADELGLTGKFVAGYIGTHGMAHSLKTVVDAAARLQDNEEIAFLFVGSGAARDAMLSRVEELGLRNVRTLPRQPKERVPALLSLCDIALIPLRDTPVFSTVIPSKMFEAAAMGTSIVMAIPKGEATRMLEESGAGLVVHPEDPDDLAEAIRSLHTDAAVRTKQAKAGRRFASKYARGVLAAQLLEVLEKVAKGPAART